METITVRLDDDLAEALHQASAQGRGKSAFVRDAIQEKLERDEAAQTKNNPSWMDRTIVYLLLELVKRLEGQKLMVPHDYNKLQEAIYCGYLHDFGQLLPIRENTLPDEIVLEVRDILFMHRVLSNAQSDFGKETGIAEEDVRFFGFDGNEEAAHFSYATFVLGTLNEFQESADTNGECENTHRPILDRYRAMLHAWKKCKSIYKPTKAEFAAIMDAATKH